MKDGASGRTASETYRFYYENPIQFNDVENFVKTKRYSSNFLYSYMQHHVAIQ